MNKIKFSTPKLIVFDWNGTILADTIPSWKAGNDCLEFYGAEPITLKRYRETVHFPVIHFYTRNGCSADNILKKSAESNVVFHSSYQRYAKNCRTRRGARQLLQYLQKRNIDCTILSNYLTPRIREGVSRLKIESYFSHICGNTDDGLKILEQTSKQQRLEDFMAKHEYQPQDTVIIGDSTEEPEIAHRLGLTSISITGGYFDEQRLKAANPDYIVNSLAEVIDILR